MIHLPWGLPTSLWLHRPSTPEELDTVVIGGGFVGLSTAWWLAREHGVRATVLEAEHLAGKASGRNAGFLLTGSAVPYVRLVEAHGRETALAFWEASRENRILLRRELLDPGTVDASFLPEGSWIAALEGTGQREDLQESLELLRAEGFDMEWRDAEAVRNASGSERLTGAIFQPEDGGLNPVRLCRAMAGLDLFAVRTGVEVRHLEPEGDRVRLVTLAGDLLARRVVVAVNAYAPSILPFLARTVRPVRGQALATAPGARHLEGVWYINDGFEYLRQLPDGTLVLGGRRQVAEGIEVGYMECPTATVQGALEEFLEESFPAFAERPVMDRWAGIMAFTETGFPLVDRVPDLPGAVYAAGFSGHGLSLGFAVGRHLARRVLGKADPVGWLTPRPPAGASARTA